VQSRYYDPIACNSELYATLCKSIEELNNSCPVELQKGLIIKNVYVNKKYVTFHQVFTNEGDVKYKDAEKVFRKELRLSKQILKKTALDSNPDFADALETLNLGLEFYNYDGNNSGKYFRVVIEPSEL